MAETIDTNVWFEFRNNHGIVLGGGHANLASIEEFATKLCKEKGVTVNIWLAGAATDTEEPKELHYVCSVSRNYQRP